MTKINRIMSFLMPSTFKSFSLLEGPSSCWRAEKEGHYQPLRLFDLPGVLTLFQGGSVPLGPGSH